MRGEGAPKALSKTISRCFSGPPRLRKAAERYRLMNVRDIVHRSDTPAGRAFDFIVLFLIVVSIITLSIDTMPSLSPMTKRILHISEVVITVLFTIEYGLRIATSERKTSYMFSFYGFVDLIAILPFYLAIGLDLRAVRVVRVFRVFHILKLTRYSSAMARFGKAVSYAKEEAFIFLLATIILLFLAAVGIYYFEHEAQPEQFGSIPHSLWWAVTTLTTVGYGDVYPVTVGGRFFTFFILMCGLGIVAVPAGLVAAALSKVRQSEGD